MTPSRRVTLAPPTPAGMEELSPQPMRRPPRPRTDCDHTASLRPFANKEEADAAVANIRNRGRLIVGLDIGSNLFSFRDPITGEITGFDVDIAGEVARDIFGTPSQVEYRILSSADRVTALQNNQVDIVVKTMTITCERKKLVNFSTRVLDRPTSGSWRRATRRSRRPPTCRASGCARRRARRRCERSSRSARRRSSSTVVTWADCLVALQQRQVDAVSTDDAILAGLVSQDPYLHIVGPSLERGALRHRRSTCRTLGWCGSSTAHWSASAATARGTRCTASG